MSEYGRQVKIRIEVDLWKWPKGFIAGSPRDITRDIQNYRFQKSIKAPQGSCQLSVMPQSTSLHILDILKPMDVLRIYEFGVLKFIGYITRVSYTGEIDPREGKPRRNATITCRQFGGLLVDANVGMGLGTALGIDGEALIDAAAELSKAILDASTDGVTFAEMITLLYSSFRDYLQAIGAKGFISYLDEYLDAESGLTSAESPFLPRTFELFNGTERSLTFWQLADQLVQRPFNEFWIDNGPRRVHVDSNETSLPEKACLVFRPTPFNGTVDSSGNEGTVWNGIEDIVIPNSHLRRFDLARSMDEVYTFYSVKEPAFQLSDIARLLLGQAIVDEDRVGKYLFKPLITELFYTRVESIAGDKQEITSGEAKGAAARAAQTLYNWFKLNDEYLSGVLRLMVPDESKEDVEFRDPRIGDKVRVYGIEGSFYVEGIAHTWQYMGPLTTDLTVTRGYDYNNNQKIGLKDRIFKRNIIQ